MRIGVIGPADPDDFADNIASALETMGHDSVLLGSPATLPGRIGSTLTTFAQRQRRISSALNSHLVSKVRESRFDLVINVVGQLDPGTVREIRRSGAGAVVLWFPDAVSNLGRQAMFEAEYDALFFKEPVLVQRARAILGAPAHYLPEACNPAWHRPPSDPGDDDEPVIVVAGNIYVWRAKLLERLAGAGVPLQIYGGRVPPWLRSDIVRSKHAGRYLRREEKARVFRSAAGVLNNLHPAEFSGVNCRLFEATGCGAAVLTEARPELRKFYEPGQEVLEFADFDELVEAARTLLASSDTSRKLGDAAAQRAHRDHTYQRRLTEVFRVLGEQDP